MGGKLFPQTPSAVAPLRRRSTIHHVSESSRAKLSPFPLLSRLAWHPSPRPSPSQSQSQHHRHGTSVENLATGLSPYPPPASLVFRPPSRPPFFASFRLPRKSADFVASRGSPEIDGRRGQKCQLVNRQRRRVFCRARGSNTHSFPASALWAGSIHLVDGPCTRTHPAHAHP